MEVIAEMILLKNINASAWNNLILIADQNHSIIKKKMLTKNRFAWGPSTHVPFNLFELWCFLYLSFNNTRVQIPVSSVKSITFILDEMMPS